MDLVPPALIVAPLLRYRTGSHRVPEGQAGDCSRELEEFVEEHTGEDALLEDVVNDKGKVTKAGVTGQLKVIQDDGEPKGDEERDALTRCLALIDAESQAGKAAKEAQSALDQRLLSRYATLTEIEIKTLVVEAKWFASIQTAIEGEVQRLTQQLAGRVKELAEHYARPLPVLEREVEAFSQKVEGHLNKWGRCGHEFERSATKAVGFDYELRSGPDRLQAD